MFKKIGSLALVVTIICTLCGTPAFAQTQSESKVKPEGRAVETASAAKSETQANGALKARMLKLVEEAKARRDVPVADPQIQPKQSNGLSKSVKIGLIVGVAVAVILVIVFIHARNHLFDDFQLGN